MKKLVSMFLIFFTLSGAARVSGAAGDGVDFALLSALKLAPPTLKEGGFATRAELAYAAAGLAGFFDIPASGTVYSDVSETNPYSGYIDILWKHKIMVGAGTGTFEPDSPATGDSAAKALVDLIGGGPQAAAYGGYPGGYRIAAAKMGVAGNVALTPAPISSGDFCRLIENTLSAEIYDELDARAGVKEKKTPLGGNMGISVYSARILSVSGNGGVSAVVLRNAGKHNPEALTAGGQYSFRAPEDFNLLPYENAEVRLWVDRDGKIAYVKLAENVEIKHTAVYAVNGDGNTDNSYAASGIKNLTLINDDKLYKTASGAAFFYNGEKASAPMLLAGRFVRLILEEGEIVRAEAWDTRPGGLVTDVNGGAVTYIAEKGVTQSFPRNLNSYDRCLVYIDGEFRDRSEIKPGTVFDWYEEENGTLIVAASEKTVTDVFSGESGDYYSFGGIDYLKANAVYYSGDGTGFKSGAGVSVLFDTVADAHFDAFGKCRFIIRSFGAKNPVNSFIGLVNGVALKAFGEGKIEITDLENDLSAKTYTFDDRLKLEGGITVSELKENGGDVDGNGIYEFTVSDDRLKKVKKAPYMDIPGHGDAIAQLSGTYQIGYASFEGRLFYYPQDYLTALYTTRDGRVRAEKISVQALVDHTVSGTTLRLFGDLETDTFRAKVLCGNTDRIYFWQYYTGVVSEKRTVADEDGNISYKVVVGDNSSGVEYRLSEEQGKNLPDNAFITYYGGVVRGDSDIILSGQAVDLTGPFSEWESLNPNFGAANMRRGRVLNRTARSIWFEDGGFYQYHLGFALRLTEGARRRFEKITVNDINIGDEVIYYLSTGEIAVRGIIVGG